MSTLAALAAMNPATHFQLLHSMYSAGAHGAARSAWIEINRPLTSLGLNQPTALFGGTQPTTGVPFNTGIQLPTVSLPIGMDIKSITTTHADVDAGWQVVNFTFGTLNLVNPQGTAGGVNLSMFDPYIEHEDRLAPWILSKTKVDVQVTAYVYNFTFVFNTTATPAGAANIFHGFSLNAFQEEQVCAIQTRIEPTDRNVGNAELINHFRQTVGAGLGLQIPAWSQPSIQGGRSAVLSPAALSPGIIHPASLFGQMGFQQQPAMNIGRIQ
jgi:hypothetical protein